MKTNYNFIKKTGGQAALIIILVTALVVTIVASTVGRTTTDVRISTQTFESLQALNAAETGIERALLQLQNDPTNTNEDCDETPVPCQLNDRNGVDTHSRYWYEFTDFPSDTATDYDIENVTQGETRTVWFTNHTDISGADPYTGSDVPLTLTWNGGGNQGIEFIYYYSTPTCPSGGAYVPTISRKYTDAASPIIETIDPTVYNNCLSFVRIRPVTGSLTNINVSGFDNTFPSQATIIDSRGLYLGSGQGAQAITRRIQYIRWNPQMPAFSDFALYAGGGIVN